MIDVQSEQDVRKVPIRRVGVREVIVPLQFADVGAKESMATIATYQLGVSLPADQKGTHMSRFLEAVYEHSRHMTRERFQEMTEALLQKLDAAEAESQVSFRYFIEKRAPVTQTPSLFDVEVELKAIAKKGAKTELEVRVDVPVQTLCPCSKAISKFGAHNQRSALRLRCVDTSLSIRELVTIAENAASAALYPLLKREDEKFVTEQAFENPKFVEDLVRDAAVGLLQSNRCARFEVAAENFESIHNHNVWAVVSSADL